MQIPLETEYSWILTTSIHTRLFKGSIILNNQLIFKANLNQRNHLWCRLNLIHIKQALLTSFQVPLASRVNRYLLSRELLLDTVWAKSLYYHSYLLDPIVKAQLYAGLYTWEKTKRTKMIEALVVNASLWLEKLLRPLRNKTTECYHSNLNRINKSLL